MIHNERTREIAASAEEVWAVLGRFMHIDEFHPMVQSVDVLSTSAGGVGAKRRCNFNDGTSVVEEVKAWDDGRSYRVRLSEFSLPLKEAFATLSVEPLGNGRSRVKMEMDYRVKFGPIGWLMGRTLMKLMTGGMFDRILKGLDAYVQANHPTAGTSPTL